MPEYLTIVSPKVDYRGVWRSMHGLRLSQPLEAEGDGDNWASIKGTTPSGTLTLNSLLYEQPGDQFCRTKMGMRTYFKRIETPHTDLQADLVARIGAAEWFIGVVAEPELSVEDGQEPCLWDIVDRLEAMCFDGSGMFNGDAELILSAGGDTGSV